MKKQKSNNKKEKKQENHIKFTMNELGLELELHSKNLSMPRLRNETLKFFRSLNAEKKDIKFKEKDNSSMFG